MAASTETRDKTVTGYPAEPGHVAAGYPAAAAYSYAVAPPVPSVSYHQSAYSSSRPTRYPYPYRNPNGATILCRLIMGAVIILSVMGLVFFITWLVLKPQLPEFQVDSASVSQLNSTRSELTATWVFTLLAQNPNHKLSIYYDRIEAFVLYGSSSLSATQVPPFYQDKKNETTVRFELGVMGGYVGEDVVKGISSDRDRGSVNFGLKLYAWIRFRYGAWRMREHLMRVYCDPVKVGFLGSNGTGSLMGQSHACQVYL